MGGKNGGTFDGKHDGGMDEDLLSHKSGSTRITASLTRTVQPSVAGDANLYMESFLQSISPELRRVVQKITGASSLKKHIADFVGKGKNMNDWN